MPGSAARRRHPQVRLIRLISQRKGDRAEATSSEKMKAGVRTLDDLAKSATASPHVGARMSTASASQNAIHGGVLGMAHHPIGLPLSQTKYCAARRDQHNDSRTSECRHGDTARPPPSPLQRSPAARARMAKRVATAINASRLIVWAAEIPAPYWSWSPRKFSTMSRMMP